MSQMGVATEQDDSRYTDQNQRGWKTEDHQGGGVGEPLQLLALLALASTRRELARPAPSNTSSNTVAMVTTGIGDKHFLIPIEAVVRVSEDFVTIEHGREKVRGALELDPPPQPGLRREIYAYYGYPVPA